MIVRKGQIWRKASESREEESCCEVDFTKDYEVADTSIDLGVLMWALNGKEAKRYSLEYIEDNFIYITTPSEEIEEPKEEETEIKIGDVVKIKEDSRYIEVFGYNEVLNLWYGKYYGRSLYRPFINFDIKDVTSVLDGADEQKPKNKYHRDLKGVTVDVYDVLKAFEVTNPALQHLIKKALCAGLRGHKDHFF